jgi:hypothetical protein
MQPRQLAATLGGCEEDRQALTRATVDQALMVALAIAEDGYPAGRKIRMRQRAFYWLALPPNLIAASESFLGLTIFVSLAFTAYGGRTNPCCRAAA